VILFCNISIVFLYGCYHCCSGIIHGSGVFVIHAGRFFVLFSVKDAVDLIVHRSHPNAQRILVFINEECIYHVSAGAVHRLWLQHGHDLAEFWQPADLHWYFMWFAVTAVSAAMPTAAPAAIPFIMVS